MNPIISIAKHLEKIGTLANEKYKPMKKIILLLVVMASFNAFSQEEKGVAIDLCVDTSFHDPNFEYLNVTIRNIYDKEVQITLGFNYQEFSNFYYQPKTCLENEIMDIKLSHYIVVEGDNYKCCSQNRNYSYSDFSDDKNNNKILKKEHSFILKIRVPKEQFSKAKKIQICLNSDAANNHKYIPRIYFSNLYEVSEIVYKCSSLKNIQSKEKVKIELTEDKTKSNSTRVYLDFKITNLTNKKIQLLTDGGYKINPQVVFSVNDTIVSDTLHFNLYHPKFVDDDIYLYNQGNDSISISSTVSNNEYLIKKEETIIIHIVMPRVEFNSIKCVKMNWFDSFAKGKNDEFEKRVLCFPLKALENK